MKFYRNQKLIGFVPVLGTLLIPIITIRELKRVSVSKKYWTFFVVTLAGVAAAVVVFNAFLMTGNNPWLNVLGSYLMLTAANILCVDYQSSAAKDNPDAEPPKSGLLIPIFCSVFAGVACVALLLFGWLSFAFRFIGNVKIEDNNGDQISSLGVITVDEVLSTETSYYSSMNSYTYSGYSTNVDDSLEDYDKEHCTFKSRSMSGIKTLQATKISQDELTLDITQDLQTGNAEIFIIVDGVLYERLSCDQNQSITLTDISNKTVIVRLGAESANISVSISRSF